jgi:hypothetical protein
MANKYMKKFSTSLAIKELKIRTTHDFSHPSQIVNHQENNNKCWRGCRKDETLIHC